MQVSEKDRDNARSAVVSAYHALDCVSIPVAFLHAFADAAVGALSTDAEPVAWQLMYCDGTASLSIYPKEEAEDYERRSPSVVSIRPLYAEPVKTAPAVAVKVKPLDWYELTSPREDGPAEPTGDWDASCGFGEYSVCLDQDGAMSETPWCVWSPDVNIGHYPSVEEAKAAAQADYEARILSALSAQVQDVAGIRAQAIEDVLSALVAHELYQYRPKAFAGFIDYARSTLINDEDGKLWRTEASPAPKHGEEG